jgi:hypothetical protein
MRGRLGVVESAVTESIATTPEWRSVTENLPESSPDRR